MNKPLYLLYLQGIKYHLLQKNCNHFASELVYQLVGKPAPAWVSETLMAGAVDSPMQQLSMSYNCWAGTNAACTCLRSCCSARADVAHEAHVNFAFWHNCVLIQCGEWCLMSCLMQINRLAGIAIALHCLLPGTWVPPLNPLADGACM